MRGLWFGLFAAVLIGGVAWGQDAGEDLLAELDAAAEAEPADQGPARLERALYPVEELIAAAAFSGHPIQPGELARFFEAGMGASFWAEREGVGRPTIASLGPVLVVWHTSEGLTEFEQFMHQVVGMMRGAGNQARAEQQIREDRRARMREEFDIPRLLVSFMRLRAIAEGRVVSDEPMERVVVQMRDVLKVLDEYYQLGGGGGVVEAVICTPRGGE